MSEPVVALVVAAGSGVRLGGEVPKALRPLSGRALVTRSVDALRAGGCTDFVIVIAPGLQAAFEDALADHRDAIHFVLGGARRQDSVAAGLEYLDAHATLRESTIVLVHDAARPLVPAAVVETVIGTIARGAKAVIPVIAVIDSVRRVGEADSQIVDRATLRAVQTPQGFDRATLTAAHRAIAADGVEVTDDAAVCERQGIHVELVEGSRDSLKVTEAIDLIQAEAILQMREGDHGDS